MAHLRTRLESGPWMEARPRGPTDTAPTHITPPSAGLTRLCKHRDYIPKLYKKENCCMSDGLIRKTAAANHGTAAALQRVQYSVNCGVATAAKVGPYRPQLRSVCSIYAQCKPQAQTALAKASLEVRPWRVLLSTVFHSSGEVGSPNLTSNPGPHHPTGSVGGSSLQGGELRLPYEVPAGGAGVVGPAGWPRPIRPFSGPSPSMGDTSHPVYGRSDRGLTIRHSFTNTPQSRVLG